MTWLELCNAYWMMDADDKRMVTLQKNSLTDNLKDDFFICAVFGMGVMSI